MGIATRTYSGERHTEILPREIRNREISRKAATEGVVLLKNNGLLPVDAKSKVAVFGNGIARVIKGGTGSGDVNERAVVSVVEGLESAGYTIINRAEADRFTADSTAAKLEWRDRVVEQFKISEAGGSDMNFFQILGETKMKDVEPMKVDPEAVKEADAVFFMISRIAGEGADRHVTEGDYDLTQTEREQLAEIAKYNKNIVVIINTGAQIDVTDLDANDDIAAIVYLSQPGMEAGHVVADILSGKVNPSGHLTATWTRKYEDFPNAKTFSHCNGDTTNEKYEEGIYVGYRYFDAFGIEPLYPFGYGLSYTTFDIEPDELTGTMVSATVTNTGSVPGKQVVQFYAACPQKNQAKELKRLIGYAKTPLLAPGETCHVEAGITAKALSSYDYEMSAWVLEAGEYGIFVAENAEDITLSGVLRVEEDTIIERVEHIVPLQTELEEIVAPKEIAEDFTVTWKVAAMGVEAIPFVASEERLIRRPDLEHFAEAKEIASKMENDELVAMLMGEITKGQDNVRENKLVETGIYVPGAAGETSCQFEEKYGVPAISMADGPAGLRLMRSYDVDNETGNIYGHGLLSALEGGFFAPEYHRENVTTYHMYATAIPIGTLLAQTWDVSLMQSVGEMIGGEMEEFGVSWWLAPGMNIHRNPLCGRNFEYYSEDPLVAGTMAAAMTLGVQKIPGVGTTIKHYACNNQEDNRMFSNSIVSERALREIYLRGFEIAVKTSQPMCLMTSYNLINSVPAANCEDLIMKVLRGEWDFKGVVMSDWTTTSFGSATPHKCAEAGNDLIMPGNQKDVDDIRKALEEGTLDRQRAVDCVARLIAVIFDTLGMEHAKPYSRIL